MVNVPFHTRQRGRHLLRWRPSLPLRVGVAAALLLAVWWSLSARLEGEALRWWSVSLLGLAFALAVFCAFRLSQRMKAMTQALQQLAQLRSAPHAPGRELDDPALSGRHDEAGELFTAIRDVVRVQNARIATSREFAADLVHEVRNPLASLHAAAEMLEQPDWGEMRLELAQMLGSDIHRIERLVGQISEAAKLERALDEEPAQPCDLVALLERVRVDTAPAAKAAGIEVVTDFPADPIWITGLEDRITQMITHLVENALSFCIEGDAVRIWARRREGRVHVVVEDTGPGIPDVALTRIFRRFYANRPAHHEGPHTGLGLAVAQQIAEAHGGALWAENIRPMPIDIGSEPLGARFVVGLPA